MRNHRLCRLRTPLAALAIAAIAAACSILPENAPVQIWQPPQAPASTPAAAPANAPTFSLRVDTPNVTGLLDDATIVVMPDPGQVSVYKGARWSEPPAILVRQRLVDAFMAAGLPSVTTDDDHFFANYSLSGDLRAFQSEYRSGSPTVVVRYDAQLRRGGSRSPLASRSFVVTQNPTGTQVPQIVEAFGAADDELARQVVAWTVEIANRDQREHPPEERRRSR